MSFFPHFVRLNRTYIKNQQGGQVFQRGRRATFCKLWSVYWWWASQPWAGVRSGSQEGAVLAALRGVWGSVWVPSGRRAWAPASPTDCAGRAVLMGPIQVPRSAETTYEPWPGCVTFEDVAVYFFPGGMEASWWGPETPVPWCDPGDLCHLLCHWLDSDHISITASLLAVLWLPRLRLSSFRSYVVFQLELGGEPWVCDRVDMTPGTARETKLGPALVIGIRRKKWYHGWVQIISGTRPVPHNVLGPIIVTVYLISIFPTHSWYFAPSIISTLNSNPGLSLTCLSSTLQWSSPSSLWCALQYWPTLTCHEFPTYP